MYTATESPFLTHHRLISLGGYTAAETLATLVLSLYNGNSYKFSCNWFRNFDQKHFDIAMSLINFYWRHGESDKDFMALAEDIKGIRKARAKAKANAVDEDDDD